MNRRAVLITFGAAVGLLALWFLLLWGPQGARATKAEKRTAAADATNTALELRLARLKSARAEVPALQATKGRLSQAIPDVPELATFILDANDAAVAAGVEFLSISPAVPAQGATSGLPEVKLSISVSGGYFEVLDYLDRLNALPRIVVVDSLGLTTGDAGKTITVSVTARMFSMTAPQVAPTTTTVLAPPPGGSSKGGSSTTTAPRAGATAP